MKIPRTQEAREEWLRLQRKEAFENGYKAGEAYARELSKKSEQAVRLDALKAVTEFIRNAGHAASVLTEAMKSERNQL